jgi:GGDEF domain-containing protein
LPLTDQVGAQVIAERLRHTIGALKIGNSQSGSSISISIGVCTLNATQTDGTVLSTKDLELVRNTMIENADKAMYKAKNDGNTQVVLGEGVNLEQLLND